MKDLYGIWGYLGSCELDGRGGYKGRLIGVEDRSPITYAGATLEELRDAHRQVITDYLDACHAAGRQPDMAPEPFGIVGSRDVRLQWDVRSVPVVVRILGYYSLRETYLRSRDHNGTARTMSAWCPLADGIRTTDIETGEKVTRFLDQYGWHPCPAWSRS